MILKTLGGSAFEYRFKFSNASIMRSNACLFLVLFLLIFPAKNVLSLESNSEESLKFELQVAMIFKILDFIEWPENSFQNSDKIFRIGVFGNSPMLGAIKQLEEETIKGLQVKVQLVENIRNTKNFHLLYVCPTQIDKLQSIITAVKNGNTLTMSKARGFAGKGGMINFYETSGKMRFEINLGKAKKHGFNISSRVLSLSKIVSTKVQ